MSPRRFRRIKGGSVTCATSTHPKVDQLWSDPGSRVRCQLSDENKNKERIKKETDTCKKKKKRVFLDKRAEV